MGELWLNVCSSCRTNNPAPAPTRPTTCAGCGQQLVVADLADPVKFCQQSYEATVAKRAAESRAAAFRKSRERLRQIRAEHESRLIERRKAKRVSERR